MSTTPKSIGLSNFSSKRKRDDQKTSSWQTYSSKHIVKKQRILNKKEKDFNKKEKDLKEFGQELLKLSATLSDILEKSYDKQEEIINEKKEEEEVAMIPHLFICEQEGDDTQYFIFHPESTKYSDIIIDTIESTYITATKLTGESWYDELSKHIDLMVAITTCAVEWDPIGRKELKEFLKILRKHFGVDFTVENLGTWFELASAPKEPVIAHTQCSNCS